ncbi:hypothetical protein CTI12_AA564190 [Artemisia annua]|uniref:Uncharacterized protein n=1 Tax=Artemisia annua TaxID=35608 RepID=A0A2U1KU36_ARTAN|nr:hypothetical protein CTI12_AA564190 [Artemisia annua]
MNRLGIRLKDVVSIEPSEAKRKILRQWWENSDQTRELVQIATIQNYQAAATDTESYAVLDFSMFVEFVRVLQCVRSALACFRGGTV